MKSHTKLKNWMIVGWGIFVCLQFFIIDALAAPVTLDRAELVATNWMRDKTGVDYRVESGPDGTVGIRAEPGGRRFYYTLNMDPGGWVIVSADDVAYPIIAYSLAGNANSVDQPPAYVDWMNKVNDSIRAATQRSVQAASTDSWSSDNTVNIIADEWQYLERPDFQPTRRGDNAEGDTTLQAVAPLLTTTWSQGLYYNQFCPADSRGPDGHALVGCCATAMGQIMKYHNYPATGYGSKSYVHPTYGTLSANFGATTYNWGAMPASGRVTSYNSAVATLLNHAGIAVTMNYGWNSSGCSPSQMAPALRNYFRYLADDIVSRASFTDATWIGKIKTDIDARRPILYGGYGTGGHAFVLDGYNDSNYFHFNWGWNGSYDGYFLITNLNPGGSNFSRDQMAVFNIRPSTPTPTVPAPPSNLRAATASASQINLTWTDNSNNESGFRIERKTGAAGTWGEIATTGANVTSYASTGLAPATTYYYRARAYNTTGNSSYSNEVYATTSTASCTSSRTAISVGQTLSGGLATTDCQSGVRSGRYYDNFTFAATAGTTYTIQLNSAAFDAYLYLLNSTGTVLAQDDDGNGGYNARIVYRATTTETLTIHATSYASGATGAYSVSLSGVAPPALPAAPSNLQAATASALQINLTWTDNSNNESGFRIERKTGAAGTWGEIATTVANVTSYASTGLTPATTYYYRARAYNTTGNSGYSNEVYATTSTASCTSSRTAISVGQTLSGGLATTDCQSGVRSGRYYDNFTFAATAGTTYTIQLNSAAFDAYAYLLNSTGAVLAQDDDGNGGYNARIVYRATTTETLTIHATSYASGATGAYTVSLSASSPSCGSSTTAIGAGQSLSGSLATTDCQSSVRSGRYYDNFTFAATAGTTYTVTLNSAAFDAYLYLLNSTGTVLAQDDDGNGGVNAKIVYRATTSGTLTIHATSYASGATGTYIVMRN